MSSHVIKPPGDTDRQEDTGNVFIDVINNLKLVLDNAVKEGTLRVREVYNYDETGLTSFPSVSIVFNGHTEAVRTMGRQATIQFNVNVTLYYYHAEALQAADRIELTKAAWDLSDIIRTNADANRFSNLGITIGQSQVVQRILDENVVKALRLDIVVPVTGKVTRSPA